MVLIGKSGKSKGKGGLARWQKVEPADEVEIDGGDDDDDEQEGVPEGDDDEEWLAFQSAILSKLVSSGAGGMSTGKLGHELGAKKKPVAAALFSLLESGMVIRRDGIPPKWSAKPGLDLSELVDAPIAERFVYDESKKRAASGPKASRDDFETVKLLVRSHLSPHGAGITAGALGFKLGAVKKVLNAALYACEKEGTAWTVTDPESGVRLRWAGQSAKCKEALPASFAYGATGAAGGAQQPPAKRARTGNAASNGDAFEDMKMCLWAKVAEAGEAGVTSGKLGYELNCDRKAVTAALYACAADGRVENIAADGPPRWKSLQEPPDSASSVDVPENFAYKGTKVPAGGAAAVKAPLTKVAKVQGLTPKQQAALAKKGGGKGAPAVVVSGGDAGSSPISFLNEWAQKSKKSLSFVDAGQDASGNFICQAVLDNEEVASAGARNKKQAKTDVAAAALEALGLA